MSRPAMVTRTIQTTEVSVLCMNLDTKTPETISFVLSGTFVDTDKALKACKKAHETETLKCVSIMSSEVKETLYGMTEQEFIAHATVLPPRGTKAEQN